MKKIVSILLILSLVGGMLHLDELAKVPFLVNHYFYHRKLNREASFISFLSDHYILHKTADSGKDDLDDTRLPFKTMSLTHFHFPPISGSLKDLALFFEKNEVVFLPYGVSMILSQPVDIWQPPKI